MLKFAQKHPYIILLAICVATTLILYGASLQLPLFMDDVILAKSVSRTSLLGIFFEPNVESYYRPLRLLPLKLIYLLTGTYHAFLLHCLNLLGEIVVAYLVALLAWELYPEKRAVGYLAALIYLIFPFNYQVVPWVSALTHLMTTSGCLLALYYAERWWNNHNWRNWFLVCVGVTLAVFSHENGVGVLYLLILLFVLKPQRLREWRTLAAFFAPIILIIMGYLAIWVLIPKDRNSVSQTLADVSQNYLYFSQGIGFPLTQFGGWIEKTFNLSPLLITGLLGLLSVMTIIVILRKASRLGLLWYFGIVSIPALFLSHAYVYDGPRLMLLASVSAAFIWSLVVLRLWEWQRWFSILFALFMIASGALFIYERMQLHLQLAGLYQQMFSSSSEHGDGVYVNLPAWLSYRKPRFAMGSEGVTYMTNYFGPNDLVELNTGKTADILGFLWPDLRPDMAPYWWGVAAPQASPEQIASEIYKRGAGYLFVNADGKWLWDSAWRIKNQQEQPSFQFENGVMLLAASAEHLGNGIVSVSLNWSLTDPLTASAQPFVHLACPDIAIITQVDGMPLRGLLPFSLWQKGEVWQDIRNLYGLPTNHEDCYVRVGLFDVQSGSRIGILNSNEDTIHIEINDPNK